jgi:hypothetical protein
VDFLTEQPPATKGTAMVDDVPARPGIEDEQFTAQRSRRPTRGRLRSGTGG